MKNQKKKRVVERLLKVPKNQIMQRNTIIIRRMVGKNFFVHAGNTYVSVAAVPSRLGTKFGAYCLTRTPTIHLKKKKK